jgi:lantibiotic modifying enzyme
VGASETYRALADDAWGWVQAQVRGDDGPWLPETVEDGTDPRPSAHRDCLYSGIAGLAPVLAELSHTRALTESEQALADSIAARLRSQAATRVEPSLYDGLAGDVTALRLLAPGSESVAVQRLADLATPEGWRTTISLQPGSDAPMTDIIMGSAGIVLAAVWSGGELASRLALTGGEALLAAADRTDAGLDWGMLPGWPSRGPNFSHGTAGIASALAVAGAAFDRPDFVAAAVEGARHLLAVGSLDDGGFIVPHTIPPTTSREVEPLTYTWCHGPTGTSQLFPALALAGVGEVGGYPVADLRRRCLHSVLTSGVPQRLRPGFWDNDGRCCGTAGVGDVLLDAAQHEADAAVGADDADRSEEYLAAAGVMADALVDRAIRDEEGARWRFVEYRADPPLLPPGTSWMQGAAGIAAFLFRYARVLDQGVDAPVVDRPDQWWGVPARLRTAQAGSRSTT